MDSKYIEVWAEGYLCTGMEGVPARATRLIAGEFLSFNDAVKCWMDANPENARYTQKRGDHWSYWGLPAVRQRGRRTGCLRLIPSRDSSSTKRWEPADTCYTATP